MMLSRALLILAVLLASSQAWANPQREKPNQSQNSQRSAEKRLTPKEVGGPPPAAGLQARQTYPKRQFVPRPANATQLIVKFSDDARARVSPNKRVTLYGALDSNAFDQVVAAHNLKFVPVFRASQETLDALTQRAADYSGRAQPDLAGLMYVEGHPAQLQAAANALVQLDCIEYVEFEVPLRPHGGGGGTSACCKPDETCEMLTAVDCALAGGTFFEGQTCSETNCQIGACCTYNQASQQWNCTENVLGEVCETGGIFRGGDCGAANCAFDCGDEELGSCFYGPPRPFPGCSNNDCCELVRSMREQCTTVEWDEACFAIANFICQPCPTTRPCPGEDLADRCATPFTSGCLTVGVTGGCNNFECCGLVCDIDPFCCVTQWDAVCVNYAQAVCQFPGGGATPELCAYQGYLRPSQYMGQKDGIPPGLPSFVEIPPFVTWGGEGMDMFAEGFGTPPGGGEPGPLRLCDDPNMPANDRWGGLYGLGRELAQQYGLGSVNGARGAGIKVAVIEWAYYRHHEDLNVIPEPGQTMIMVPSITEPDHATACLGIINAQANGFGMTGIAPDAQAYFFPLTSVEEGPRTSAAFISAFNTLGPGDVISMSFGPGPPVFNLNNTLFGNTMMRLGTELGITMVLAAGNDCANLDTVPEDMGDSGAIVVGACYPGAPWCRLPFSNFYRSSTIANSHFVHVSAWGEAVAATGYGDLFMPGGNKNRAYTHTFNGTSAATPQVAAVVACLQGLAKQFYGVPVTPTMVRAALMGDTWAQCGILNPPSRPGFNPDVGCGPDTSLDFPANIIGNYIRPQAAASFLLAQSPTGFDQSPHVHELYILRGNHLFGNKFSIKASDGQYLVVQSLFTPREHVPSVGVPGSEAHTVSSQAKYVATSYTVDLMVRATSPVKRPEALSILAEVVSTDLFGLAILEVYDWMQQKWVFVNLANLPPSAPGANTLVAGVAQNAPRYLSPTQNIYARVYMLGINSDGDLPDGGTAKRIDWIDVRPTSGFGGILVP